MKSIKCNATESGEQHLRGSEAGRIPIVLSRYCLWCSSRISAWSKTIHPIKSMIYESSQLFEVILSADDITWGVQLLDKIT